VCACGLYRGCSGYKDADFFCRGGKLSESESEEAVCPRPLRHDCLVWMVPGDK